MKPLVLAGIAFFVGSRIACTQALSVSEGLVPPGMKVGPVNGSYPLGDLDSINLFNGKVNLAIPLLQVGGRGEAGYAMSLTLESSNWQVVPHGTNGKNIEDGWEEVPSAGLSPGFLRKQSMAEPFVCGNPTRTVAGVTYTAYLLSRPGGGSLEFFPINSPSPRTWTSCATNQPNFSRGQTFRSRDGSAATLVLDTAPLENLDAVGSNGAVGNDEPTGYVIFKSGVRYNVTAGKIVSITDRNGNRVALEYYTAADIPKSTVLNLLVTAAFPQSFDVNLPTVVQGVSLSQRAEVRLETRLHDFIFPAGTGSSMIWSSASGGGPKLVLRNGALEAQLTEPGSTTGCSVSLSGRSDVVVRFQREATGPSTGQYRLAVWDFAKDSRAPFATAACPSGQSNSINVSGLMSIGSDANRTGTSLYKGRMAYLRVYPTTTTSAVQPGETSDGALLDYRFDDPTSFYTLDHANLQNLTRYNSPDGSTTPGETVLNTGLLKAVVDSIGRRVDISLNQEISPNNYRQTIVYSGFDATRRTITIDSVPLASALRTGAVQTVVSLFGTAYDNGQEMVNPVKIRRLELADGREYRFGYNVCGEIAEVTLPTGGMYQYDWDGESGREASGMCRGRSPAFGGVQRYLTERRSYVSSTTLESRLAFSRTTIPCGSDCAGTVASNTVVGSVRHDGAGNKIGIERHIYYDEPYKAKSLLAFPGWKEGKEYRGEVMKTELASLTDMTGPTDNYQKTLQTWKQYSSTDPGGVVSAYTAEEDRPRVAQVETTIVDSGTARSRAERFLHDQYNNVTSVIETDWGSNGVPGLSLRTKVIGYKADGYDTDLAVHLRSLVSSETVSLGENGTVESSVQYFYDEYSSQPGLSLETRTDVIGRQPGFSTNMRGNVTRVRRLLSGTTYIETKQRYDELGNVIEAWDAEGMAADYKTTFDYTDQLSEKTKPGAGKTFAFISKITHALPKAGAAGVYETKGVYDLYIGRLVSATDMNGVMTTYLYNDALDRPTSYSRPGQSISFDYPSYNSVVTKIPQNSCAVQAQELLTTEEYDGLGRLSRKKVKESATTNITTETTYDGAGRVKEQFNPTRSASNTGVKKSEYTYDWLGRPLSITLPGLAVRRYGYRANQTWIRDEAGKWSQQITDGVGRLTSVTEDPIVTDSTIIPSVVNSSGLNYLTTYTYDARGNLKTVTQGSLNQRIFNYNALGWLTDATNPESGRIDYGYDNNGNLTSRTDSRGGAKVTYGRDRWNRLTAKTYTAGAAQATSSVSYTYDSHTVGSFTSYPKGRLTAVSVANGTTVRYDQYDALGRVLRSTQSTDGRDFAFAYTYNSAGGMESVQYPNTNRVVTTCFDEAGRLLSLRNGGASATDVYAEAAEGADPETAVQVKAYHEFGGLQRVKLDSGKLMQRWDYNDRGQTITLGMHKTPQGQTASVLMKLGLGYGADSANNGNVASQSIQIGGGAFTASQAYTYDKLNRLETAVEGTNWKQKFGYDQWGNRWMDESQTSGIAVPSGTPVSSSAYLAGTNRLAGVPVDAAGNTSPLSGRTYLYDVENRIVSVSGGTAALQESMQYDGEGRRVLRIAGGLKTVYVYTAGGELAQEYGGLVEPTGRSYLFADHLGSTRMRVAGDGTVQGWWDYAPFGEELPGGAGSRTGAGLAAWKYGGVAAQSPSAMFTGQVRDRLADGVQSGLDYFGARYMSSVQGRFTSPDPHNIITEASGEEEFASFLSNPQNWNRYAYVTNNPLSITDPDGRCPACLMWAQQLAARGSAMASQAAQAASRWGSQASQAAQRYGQQAYVWGTQFFNSPTGQEATAAAAEMVTGAQLPFGFSNVGQFQQFGKTLSSGLREVAGEGVQSFLGGSAITGKSFATGAAFDVGRTSDFDVAVVGGNLLAKARELGIELRGKGTRTGPLGAQALKALGLDKLAQKLSQQAGRPVNFMIYESEEALRQRGAPYQGLQ